MCIARVPHLTVRLLGAEVGGFRYSENPTRAIEHIPPRTQAKKKTTSRPQLSSPHPIYPKQNQQHPHAERLPPTCYTQYSDEKRSPGAGRDFCLTHINFKKETPLVKTVKSILCTGTTRQPFESRDFSLSIVPKSGPKSFLSKTLHEKVLRGEA